MRLFVDRRSGELETALDDTLNNLQHRFMYCGNVLTFLGGKRRESFAKLFANDRREIKILLMYPFALFSRDRMAAESHRIPFERNVGKDHQFFDNFICGATYDTRQSHWIPDRLSTTLKRLLGTLGFPPGNIRLSTLNPLCSALVCDARAFVTPYHYGRKTEEAECTAQNSPVILLEEQDALFELVLDHINYLWNRPTAYPVELCVNRYEDPTRLVVKKPEELRFPVDILLDGGEFYDLGLIAERIAQSYCPKESIPLQRAVFFSHSRRRLEDVRELKRVVKNEFYAEAYALLDEDHTGELLLDTLAERIGRCSHAIVLAERDENGSSGYPTANVLHELGWCQALLGKVQVLVLRLPDTTLPANIGGLIYSDYKGLVEDIDYVRRWLVDRGFQERGRL